MRRPHASVAAHLGPRRCGDRRAARALLTFPGLASLSRAAYRCILLCCCHTYAETPCLSVRLPACLFPPSPSHSPQVVPFDACFDAYVQLLRPRWVRIFRRGDHLPMLSRPAALQELVLLFLRNELAPGTVRV